MDSFLPIRCNFPVLVVLFNDTWRVDITLFVLKKTVCMQSPAYRLFF